MNQILKSVLASNTKWPAVVSKLFDSQKNKLQEQSEIEYIRERVLAKFPLLGTTMAQLKTERSQHIKIAATDGKTVFYNPNIFMGLSDDEKTFIYAHEVMHVAFNHIMRSENRDQDLWGTATDAVINQMLLSEKLTVPRFGGINIPDAAQYSAEEMYEKLLQQKQNKQQNQSSAANDNYDVSNPPQNHQIWAQAVKEANKQKSNQKSQPQQSSGDKKDDDKSDAEKSFTQQNRDERSRRAAEIQRQMNAEKNKIIGNGVGELDRIFGPVGISNPAMNWKKILRQSIEKETDRWSYRRSDADNDYMARVDEQFDDDNAEIEVIIDVSGSVGDEFLREFLRQLKPLLKNGELRVGFFDTRFYPFVKIESNRDIERLHIPGGGGTDMDIPLQNFSKKPLVNKIVFTDGWGDTTDRRFANMKNLVWLVYENNDFHPICGRVINVDPGTITQNFITMSMIAHKTQSR